MITLNILCPSHYIINRQSLQSAVEQVLRARVKGDVEVSILVCGDRKMKSLNTKYRNIAKTTDVLSFPIHDPSQPMGEFSLPPDNILHLGDIVVSYPQCIKEAALENMMVDDKLNQLVLHGIDHLMGIHHD